MTGLELSLKPKERYEDKLLRQLEECSHEGISCELCTNETRCRELYDMLPIFINESICERYSKEFASFGLTKEVRDNHVFCRYLFSGRQR